MIVLSFDGETGLFVVNPHASLNFRIGRIPREDDYVVLPNGHIFRIKSFKTPIETVKVENIPEGATVFFADPAGI